MLERSKVARTVPEQDILEQFGASVLIIHLHGMNFFGSANSVNACSQAAGRGRGNVAPTPRSPC